MLAIGTSFLGRVRPRIAAGCLMLLQHVLSILDVLLTKKSPSRKGPTGAWNDPFLNEI